MLPILNTNSILPAVTTASVTTYPTTLLFNTAAPSIVYERRIGAPIFPIDIPVLGIECQKLRITEENDLARLNEKKLDDLIKQKVEDQIYKYQREHEENERVLKCRSIENFDFSYEKECNCKCRDKKERELTLDEKIQRIREELNLPNEKDQDKLIKKLHEYEKKYEKCTNTEKDYSENVRNHYKIDYIESRSRTPIKRSTSSHSRKSSKSRSPSAIRQPWIPTGSNDYTSTNLKRESLINKQRNYIPFDSEPSNSLVFFENSKKSASSENLYYVEPKKSTYLTIEKVTPAKTIISTTVDSKSYVKSKPTLEYYCSTNYVTDHSNKPKNIVYKSSTKEPFYYEKTVYPLAKEYYYHPVRNSTSYYAKN
ncbi:unnamed protein product [Brachionus calyciflorus]|uniref:Uncharacterized protein n=1 Tax=Brachionus calyciflorus TaxID=104777 RepID=A0A814FCP9_9BILA|nr:unnamed protein product [Brachionus calyciflorus]